MPLCAKSMIMNEVKRYFSLCRLKQNKATTAFNAITVLLKNYLQQRIYHHWWPASPWTVLAESPTNVCINCPPGGIEKVLDGISVGSGGLRESWASFESA